jgi:hypothetical protein
MATVGGLLATTTDRARFEGPGLDDFDFICEGEEAFVLEIPRLTLSELRFLNKRMPTSSSALRELKKIPNDHVERYRKLYRYFPAFAEVETTL